MKWRVSLPPPPCLATLPPLVRSGPRHYFTVAEFNNASRSNAASSKSSSFAAPGRTQSTPNEGGGHRTRAGGALAGFRGFSRGRRRTVPCFGSYRRTNSATNTASHWFLGSRVTVARQFPCRGVYSIAPVFTVASDARPPRYYVRRKRGTPGAIAYSRGRWRPAHAIPVAGLTFAESARAYDARSWRTWCRYPRWYRS